MGKYLKKNELYFFIFGFMVFNGIYGCSKKNVKKVVYEENTRNAVITCKLPESISFCGERVPLENQFVWESLDREFTLEVWDRGQVILWFKRTGHYFPFIENELRKSGLPDDLKYTPVIESALISNIGSYQGARGLWQFMKNTARANGLRVDNTLDERRCYRRATVAALGYLKELYNQFGSWSLALAAYNCGETQLRRKIREQNTNDYYNLILPNETERFVYRIVASKIIFENLPEYGFNLDDEERYKPYDLDFIPINVSNLIKIHDIATSMGLSEKLFLFYNPQCISAYLPLNKYSVHIPKNTESTFRKALNSLSGNAAEMEIKNEIYIVKPGDSLSRISKVTGIALKKLKALNNISGSHIWIGQKLRLK